MAPSKAFYRNKTKELDSANGYSRVHTIEEDCNLLESLTYQWTTGETNQNWFAQLSERYAGTRTTVEVKQNNAFRSVPERNMDDSHVAYESFNSNSNLLEIKVTVRRTQNTRFIKKLNIAK